MISKTSAFLAPVLLYYKFNKILLMRFHILAAIVITTASHTAWAKQHADDCLQVVGQAYAFIEQALKEKPELAYSPVRTNETSGMLMEACMDGMTQGHHHDTGKLTMLFENVETESHRLHPSLEQSRFLVNHEAMAQAYLDGYEIGNDGGAR